MKRLMILILVVIFALSVAGFAAGKASAKAKVASKAKASAKAIRAADEKAIKQAALKYCNASPSGIMDRGKPFETKVGFEPIEFAGGNWATTMFTFTPVDHPEDGFSPDSCILLKKSGGKWRVVAKYYGGAIKPAKANQIGLSAAVAKKLKIRISTTAD